MNGFSDRLEALRARIAAACSRAGRDPDSVRIVAVSKTFGPDAVSEAASAGQVVFGESRVQEARQKIPACPGHLEWHMVGHLQRNKVRETVELFSTIHAVDSLRLLEAVEQAAAEAGRRMPVLVEVNVSGESSKFGMKPAEVPVLLEAANGLHHVSVVGLMTVPPFDPEPLRVRPIFRKLRELRDEWAGRFSMELAELSMGMTHDFEVAVEEGATWVRVGSFLFGHRPKAAPGNAGEMDA